MFAITSAAFHKTAYSKVLPCRFRNYKIIDVSKPIDIRDVYRIVLTHDLVQKFALPDTQVLEHLAEYMMDNARSLNSPEQHCSSLCIPISSLEINRRWLILFWGTSDCLRAISDQMVGFSSYWDMNETQGNSRLWLYGFSTSEYLSYVGNASDSISQMPVTALWEYLNSPSLAPL